MSVTPTPIILFDGVCGLCARSVLFVIRHETYPIFRFAAFQSETGRQLCLRHKIDPELPDSLVVISENKALFRSDEVIAIANQLGGLWRGLAFLRLVPRSWRDWCYGIIAQNRYALFGRHTVCQVPPSAIQNRFLP